MLSLLLFTSFALASLPAQNPGDLQTREQKFRQDYEADLKRDEGWLKVAGLMWLSEGENSLGSGSENKVLLPPGTPAEVGTLTLTGGKVSLKVRDGATVLLNGQPTTGADLKFNEDSVKIGDVHFRIIQRGNRIGVRLYDPNCEGFKNFKGLHWYPVSAEYVVKAKFVPYNPPKTIQITNVLGDTTPSPSIGYVEFTMAGKTCRLDTEASGGGLFLNFQDLTSGDTTYPPGRFLDAPAPKDGAVELDFNQAINPPCAFTNFATCPLPPQGNRIPVAIKAGEMVHHPGH